MVWNLGGASKEPGSWILHCRDDAGGVRGTGERREGGVGTISGRHLEAVLSTGEGPKLWSQSAFRPHCFLLCYLGKVT